VSGARVLPAGWSYSAPLRREAGGGRREAGGWRWEVGSVVVAPLPSSRFGVRFSRLFVRSRQLGERIARKSESSPVVFGFCADLRVE